MVGIRPTIVIGAPCASSPTSPRRESASADSMRRKCAANLISLAIYAVMHIGTQPSALCCHKRHSATHKTLPIQSPYWGASADRSKVVCLFVVLPLQQPYYADVGGLFTFL
jgi:hypothetical protein